MLANKAACILAVVARAATVPRGVASARSPCHCLPASAIAAPLSAPVVAALFSTSTHAAHFERDTATAIPSEHPYVRGISTSAPLHAGEGSTERGASRTLLAILEGGRRGSEVAVTVADSLLIAQLKEKVAEKLSLEGTPLRDITLHLETAGVASAGTALDGGATVKEALPETSRPTRIVVKIATTAKPTAATSSAGLTDEVLGTILTAVKEQGAATRAILSRSFGSVSVTATTNAAELASVNLSILEQLPGGLVPPSVVGPAVLSVSQQAELRALARNGQEVDIIRFLTPYLARLRLPQSSTPVPADPCPPMLVNSEVHQWLAPRNINDTRLHKKPDLFRTWRPFVAIREGKDKQGKGPEYVFGRLADVRLQLAGCVRELYECKVSLSDSDFGVLCGYQFSIEGPCYGMLFDATQFWLYESFNGTPVHLTKGHWTAAGSAATIQAFFDRVPEPPLVSLLRRTLHRLNVPLRFIDRPTSNSTEQRAHLGSGGFGHAFAVGDPKSPPLALKLVIGKDDSRVRQEFDLLQSAAAKGAPVVKPVPHSLVLDDDGSGYVLEEVGKPFFVSNGDQCREAFAVLALLHRAGVVHGDPRLPNLLTCAGGLHWIDPAGSSSYTSEASRRDCARLARSVLGLEEFVKLPVQVTAKIDSYDMASAASVDAVADAVWKAM